MASNASNNAGSNASAPTGKPWRECRPQNHPNRRFQINLDDFRPGGIEERRAAIYSFCLYLAGGSQTRIDQVREQAIEDTFQGIYDRGIEVISMNFFLLSVDLAVWTQYFKSLPVSQRPCFPWQYILDAMPQDSKPWSNSYCQWLLLRAEPERQAAEAPEALETPEAGAITARAEAPAPSVAIAEDANKPMENETEATELPADIREIFASWFTPIETSRERHGGQLYV